MHAGSVRLRLAIGDFSLDGDNGIFRASGVHQSEPAKSLACSGAVGR